MFAGLQRPQTKNASSRNKAAPDDVARHRNHSRELNPLWQSLATLPIGLQTKLTISQPGDPYELEADRVAERVMRMAAPRSHPTIQRKCGPCEEEEQKLQRKENGAGPVQMAAPSISHTLASAGRPLDASSRTFFESRFGRDFSNVRIHSDAKAAESARSVNALAYTVGQNIVFGAGQYSPRTATGQSLLAHELSHVCQQTNGLLLRTPDPATLAEFNTRVTILKNFPLYKKLGWEAKQEVEEILTEARNRDNALYLIEKLELLFTTPEESAKKTAKDLSEKTALAAGVEKDRLAKEPRKSRTGIEEDVSKNPSREFKPAKAPDGTIFKIDARDPTDIAIIAKVRLVKAGAETTKTDVENVESLQDAIEKRMAVLGYSVDLEFVKKSRFDVFTVNVNAAEWTTAGNWIGDDAGLAHELHHLLGLQEDRYNYIEAHAANPKMKIPDRVHWFLMELRKVVQNNKLSIMSSGRNPPLDDDICTIAFRENPAEKDDCIKKRTKARLDLIRPAQGTAFTRADKAHSNLANIRPPDPHEKPGEPSIGQLKQRWAMLRAEMIFGKPISLERALDIVGALRHELLMNNLFVVAELTPGCDENHAVSRPEPPQILLCPSFFSASVQEQTDALLLEAVRRAGVGMKGGGNDCPTSACDSVCGDETQPQAWVRFVECIENLGS